MSPSGVVTRVAGDGFYANDQGDGRFAGDGGSATDASLNRPNSLAVDGAGNVYIADGDNYRIRRVDATTGIVTTVAGNGQQAPELSTWSLAAGMFTGDGLPATEVSLGPELGISLGGSGDLYIGDRHNRRVLKVDVGTGVLTTAAGGGQRLSGPTGLFRDGSGDLYFVNQYSNQVFRVSPAGAIALVAGTGDQGFSGDGGPAVGASLDEARSVFVDGGAISTSGTATTTGFGRWMRPRAPSPRWRAMGRRVFPGMAVRRRMRA